VTALRRTTPALLALVAAWLLASVAAAGPAAAHAELISTSPGEGARLAEAPAEVTLEFSEGVTLGAGYARVQDAEGDRVDTGAADVDGGVVTVPLRGDLPDGGYLVSYRVVSLDSHPIAGSFSFVVGEGEPVSADVAGDDDTDPVVAAALPVTRWLGFAGLALAAGVPLFVVACLPGGWAAARLRRLFAWGVGLVAGGAVAGFLLQGPYGAATGLDTLLDPALLRATASSEAGWALLVRAVLAGALAAALLPHWRRGRPPGRPQLLGAGVAALGLALSAAAVGHAVAGPWPALAVVVTTVHVAAMAAWLGGLAALIAVVLRGDGPAADVATALPRFSAMAFAAVAALVLSGVVQAVREVGSPSALGSTTYGQVLIAKLVVVLVILAAAAVSRVWVQQRLGVRRPRPGSRRRLTAQAFAAAETTAETPAGTTAVEPAEERARAQAESAVEHLPALRRSVLLEFALAAVVLALSAVLVGTPPARTAVAEPVDVTLPLQGSGGAEGSVQVSVDPARPGANTLHVYLFDGSGRLVQPAELRVALTEQEQDIGPLDVALQPAGPGHYVGEGMTLPGAGRWTLTVTTRLDEFTALTASTSFPVR
jgi:copper transport protein